jgi:UDP-glucose 4-epimerase
MNLTNSQILITGGAGFIGSNLAKRLVKTSNEITVLDNLSIGKEINIPKGAFFLKSDVKDILNYAFHWDIIFHLAALPRIQPSFNNPVETFDANVLGTLNVLEYAKFEHSKVIYAGSSSYQGGILTSPYAFSKMVGWQACELYNKHFGIPVANARFYNVYGPDQIEEGEYSTVMGIFEKCYRENKSFPVVGNGKQRRDFTHIDDIIDGLELLADYNFTNDIFEFGSGHNYSINELVSCFNSDYTYIAERPGEYLTTLADNRSTKEKLTWLPKQDITEYIKKLNNK